jgi:MFS family permease
VADSASEAGPATGVPGQPTETAAPEPKPRPLLLTRDYAGWWSGNTISALGTSISSIAFPLLVLYSTGSVAKAGVISAASMIGTLATTLWGGALADRASRKAILIVGPVVQAAALGTVALLARSGRVPLFMLAAMACVSGLASGVTLGAQGPAMRRIVPRAQLATATSQMFGRDMAAEVVGSPLGGFLFSVARWLPFGADAVSFLFASLGAALIRRPLGPDRRSAEQQTTMIADIREGIGFVRRQPFLRFVVIFGSLINVLGAAWSLAFIAVLKYRGATPTEIGLAMSVALVGGIAGAVAAPVVLRRVPARLVLYVTVWLFALSTAGGAIAPRLWEIAVALLVGMIGLAPLNVVIEAYAVRLTPDALMGRASAVSRFGGMSLQWTGPLLAGLLADLLGPPGGALVLAVALVPFGVSLYLAKSLRVLDQSLDEVTEFPVPQGL